MGVRGLKTFLERENQIRPINISDEINEWKRKNPGKTPEIVIDFMSSTHCVASKDEGTFCGGRHQKTLEAWKDILSTLKATGADLVFFSDLILQDDKSESWLSRRNEQFDFYTSIYDLIEIGAGIESILGIAQEKKGLTSKFHGMQLIAENFGNFHHSVQHECDLDIAQYAKNNNALAVISNDTDFMIFEGSWKLWSNDFTITASKQLKTLEYDRKGFPRLCSLSPDQLPLFATLMSNDFTVAHFEELRQFHFTLGQLRNKVLNIASFVRKFNCNPLSDLNIEILVRRIFGYAIDEKKKLFKQSIDSYKTDFPPMKIDDPLENKLFKTRMYRPYMNVMRLNQGITMPFYDMRGCKPESNLPMLIAAWLKREIGVVRKQSKNNDFTFTLLMKKNIHQFYQAYTEVPIYPDFFVPPLDKLYSEAEDDSEINKIRWKILGFIMSMPDKIVSILETLPKDYLLISAILYALVKNGFIGEIEANGILYAEHKVLNNEIGDVQYPSSLKSKNVRAAHLYNIAYLKICQIFAIAGLLPRIQEILQFDGVYYQKLMEKVDQMTASDRGKLFKPIENYQIYAQD